MSLLTPSCLHTMSKEILLAMIPDVIITRLTWPFNIHVKPHYSDSNLRLGPCELNSDQTLKLCQIEPNDATDLHMGLQEYALVATEVLGR
jgi:hypothetical protein